MCVIAGPNGRSDHRVTATHHFQSVGIGERTPELTGALGYLNRASPGAPFPKAKNGSAGEIGWVYDTFQITKGI
jgi:hypothetical protein